jgi:hypothetical protein
MDTRYPCIKSLVEKLNIAPTHAQHDYKRRLPLPSACTLHMSQIRTQFLIISHLNRNLPIPLLASISNQALDFDHRAPRVFSCRQLANLRDRCVVQDGEPYSFGGKGRCRVGMETEVNRNWHRGLCCRGWGVVRLFVGWVGGLSRSIGLGSLCVLLVLIMVGLVRREDGCVACS